MHKSIQTKNQQQILNSIRHYSHLYDIYKEKVLERSAWLSFYKTDDFVNLVISLFNLL